MTALDQVQQLLTKLDNPYWTPLPTQKYLTNWQGHVAQFNMYYMLRGQPSSHLPGDISKHMAYWKLAGEIIKTVTPSGPLSETILAATPVEVYDHVIKPKEILYSVFMSPSEWKRILNETRQDSLPANVAPYRAKLAGKPNQQR